VKTCFLKRLLAERCTGGPAKRSILLSFHGLLAGSDASELDALLETYFPLHPEIRPRDGKKGRAAWPLSEIPRVDGWDRFVRRVLVTEPLENVVPSSSARMVPREIYSSFRGRGMPTMIAPFCFHQALRRELAAEDGGRRLALGALGGSRADCSSTTWAPTGATGGIRPASAYIPATALETCAPRPIATKPTARNGHVGLTP
jgi:hypothetical protein